VFFSDAKVIQFFEKARETLPHRPILNCKRDGSLYCCRGCQAHSKMSIGVDKFMTGLGTDLVRPWYGEKRGSLKNQNEM